ncbi:hypothetical protein [Streptomyces radicis]|nr:hypothetical protein [Streptomyces radicis]
MRHLQRLGDLHGPDERRLQDLPDLQRERPVTASVIAALRTAAARHLYHR